LHIVLAIGHIYVTTPLQGLTYVYNFLTSTAMLCLLCVQGRVRLWWHELWQTSAAVATQR